MREPVLAEAEAIARSTFGEAKLRADLLYDLQCAGGVVRRRLAAELHRSGGESVLGLIEKATERSGIKNLGLL